MCLAKKYTLPQMDNVRRPPELLPAASSYVGARYRLWRGAPGAGVPVVAGASSGIQVIALRSYLNPLAVLSASFVEFSTRYHLLLFLVVVRTESKGTATSFSPIPR